MYGTKLQTGLPRISKIHTCSPISGSMIRRLFPHRSRSMGNGNAGKWVSSLFRQLSECILGHWIFNGGSVFNLLLQQIKWRSCGDIFAGNRARLLFSQNKRTNGSRKSSSGNASRRLWEQSRSFNCRQCSISDKVRISLNEQLNSSKVTGNSGRTSTWLWENLQTVSCVFRKDGTEDKRLCDASNSFKFFGNCDGKYRSLFKEQLKKSKFSGRRICDRLVRLFCEQLKSNRFEKDSIVGIVLVNPGLPWIFKEKMPSRFRLFKYFFKVSVSKKISTSLTLSFNGSFCFFEGGILFFSLGKLSLNAFFYFLFLFSVFIFCFIFIFYWFLLKKKKESKDERKTKEKRKKNERKTKKRKKLFLFQGMFGTLVI